MTNAWLKSCCENTSLDLGNHKLGPEGAKHLAEALQNENCKLTSLNLMNTHLGPDRAPTGPKGAKHLFIAL